MTLAMEKTPACLEVSEETQQPIHFTGSGLGFRLNSIHLLSLQHVIKKGKAWASRVGGPCLAHLPWTDPQEGCLGGIVRPSRMRSCCGKITEFCWQPRCHSGYWLHLCRVSPDHLQLLPPPPHSATRHEAPPVSSRATSLPQVVFR